MEAQPANPMRVQKARQLIILTLQDQTRIKGYVYLPQSGRLSDLMNHQAAERPFLAMTDATIRLPDGTRHTAPFLSVNRNAVTTCFPTSDATADGQKATAARTRQRA